MQTWADASLKVNLAVSDCMNVYISIPLPQSFARWGRIGSITYVVNAKMSADNDEDKMPLEALNDCLNGFFNKAGFHWLVCLRPVLPQPWRMMRFAVKTHTLRFCPQHHLQMTTRILSQLLPRLSMRPRCHRQHFMMVHLRLSLRKLQRSSRQEAQSLGFWWFLCPFTLWIGFIPWSFHVAHTSSYIHAELLMCSFRLRLCFWV